MSTVPVPDYVTVRELYATLDARDAKTASAIVEMKQELVHQFELHEQAHQAEDAKRTARGRWMVGTALTIGGLGGGFIGHVIERLLG
jgi:ATP-dependent protease ClpP protease subunit